MLFLVGKYPPGHSGDASVTMEQVQEAVDWCYENGIQIITHTNGEGASDMLIAAILFLRTFPSAAETRGHCTHVWALWRKV